MGPAARVADMHICPEVAPIPHVGGPLLPMPSTVLIGGLPAAGVGQECLCVGPLDVVVMGSLTVFINGRPAARMGDETAHGGVIVSGWPTVIVGG